MSRSLVFCVTLLLALAPRSWTQGAEGLSLPPQGGIPQPVLAEHATGGEVPAAVLSASFLGLAVYDVFTAPESARWHNARYPGASPKSPTTALWLSLGATTIPAVAGVIVSRAAPEIGVPMIYSGVLIGPSVGHWYAGRAARGWTTLGLRAGLSLATVAMLFCCT